MVLQTDFLTDGADHNRMFNFELELCKKINREEERRKLNEYQKNQRYKSVVCRHWVKDLCMKQGDCEFLHELSAQRMPECRWGEKCQVPDCMFKHTKEEDRQECMFYKIGFCKKGLMCRFRHIRYPPEELPEELNWDDIGDNRNLTVTEITAVEDGVEKKTLVQHNENYKVAICKHWKLGLDCPFGARCHFAHGAHELRGKGTDSQERQKAPPTTTLQTIIQQFQASSTNREPTKDSGSDLDLPDNEFIRTVPPIYIILRTATMENIAASFKYECWSINPVFMEQLNNSFHKAPVFLFMYANDTNMFAGVARMTSPVEHVVNPPEFVTLPPEANDNTGNRHGFMFSVSWLRACELVFTHTAYLTTPQRELDMYVPVAMAFECTELSKQAGHSLMIMIYREPSAQINPAELPDSIKMSVHMEGPDPALSEPVDEHNELMDAFDAENPGVRPRPDFTGTSLVATTGAGGIPIVPGSIPITMSGFVLGCHDDAHVKEMIKLGLVAAPSNRRSAIDAHIGPGTLMVVHSLEESKIYGIFEAIRPPDLYEERAFLKGNTCQLPIQIPFNRVLDAPPLDSNRIPQIVLQTDGGDDACWVTVDSVEMQKLANLFASNNSANTQGVAESAAVDSQEISPEYPPGISVVDGPGNRPGALHSSVIVNVAFHPGFKAAHQMIGKKGGNIKRVLDETGARCSIQALSKIPQEGTISGPMVVRLTASEPDSIAKGVELVKQMVGDIIHKYNTEFLPNVKHNMERGRNQSDSRRRMPHDEASVMSTDSFDRNSRRGPMPGRDRRDDDRNDRRNSGGGRRGGFQRPAGPYNDQTPPNRGRDDGRPGGDHGNNDRGPSDNRGRDDRGPDNRGRDDRGPGNRGRDDRGPGNRGRDDRGPPDNRGRDDRGPPDNRGRDDRGPDNRGRDDRGPPDNRGRDDRGPDNRGRGDRGPDNRGRDDRGPANRGRDDRGPGNRGRDDEKLSEGPRGGGGGRGPRDSRNDRNQGGGGRNNNNRGGGRNQRERSPMRR